MPIWGLVEGCFVSPMGGSIAVICVEKQVKVLACSFWFGGFAMCLSAIYRKNKLIFISLAVFGVGIFVLILTDTTFCHRVASQIMAQPFGRVFKTQLGQFGGLLFGGIFMKSAHFSVYTFALYLVLIYSSKIHKNILDLPLLPQN